jgi:hypothetical protein
MGRRGYPPEFRRKVVDLVEAGRSVADVARERLGACRARPCGLGAPGPSLLLQVDAAYARASSGWLELPNQRSVTTGCLRLLANNAGMVPGVCRWPAVP